MKTKVGQLLTMGIQGTSLSKEEATFITQNDIGGIILFDRNIESPEQLHGLTSELHSLKQKTKSQLPLLISIDMEGGRVARLKAPFTQWPSMKRVSEIDSTSLAFKLALYMGEELKSMGINLNFSPCVDVLTNPKNEVIGDRSFGPDPEQVSKMSSALVRGFIKAGILPCAKHFPGHGNTFADSHFELPIEDVDLERLRSLELIPFKKVFRARLDFVMTAHIQFPKIDPDYPVTLSHYFLNDILRDEYRYRGLVISDDLDMQALTHHFKKEEIPVKALNAGCDILLYCNDPVSPVLALDSLLKAVDSGEVPKARVEESFKRVIALKNQALKNFSMPTFDEATAIIGHPEHLKLSNALKSGDIPEELTRT